MKQTLGLCRREGGINIHTALQAFRLRLICAFTACALVLAPGLAPAADDPEYLAEYKLYNQALDDGDAEAAARHGRAAWQAAETALGDHRLTAILAYNYGKLVLFSDANAALPALERAKELLDAGVAELPAGELGVYFAYAQFVVSGDGRRRKNRLRQALMDFGEAGYADPNVASMWLHVATNDVNDKQYDRAKESAKFAEAAISVSRPNESRLLAQAILLSGIARLVPFPREISDVRAAHEDFTRAEQLFPLQKNLETFDKVLAKILVWHAAARAALHSEGETAFPEGEESLPAASRPFAFYFEEAKPQYECGYEWDKRVPPRFPFRAELQGHIGAVLIGYRLGDDIFVHDARILAETSSDPFGKTALKSMENWRLKAPPPDDPACRENRITQFTFEFKSE